MPDCMPEVLTDRPKRTESAPMPNPPRKPQLRRVRTAADKLQIRVVEAVERGHRVRFYRVEGYLPDGTRLRKRFKTLGEAEGALSVHRVKATNSKTALNSITTPLSLDEVRDAEAALTRLKGRHSLAEAVDYFLRHYAAPDEAKPLPDAQADFLDAREKGGVRPRSILQLKSTIKAFIAWKTLAALPPEFAPDVRLAQASLPLEKADHPASIIKALSIALDHVPRPAVHEVTTADVRAFLEGLRDKTGTAPAGPKTWNNYRADLHAFFAWCCHSSRRWIRNNPVSDIDKLKPGRGIPTALSLQQARDLMEQVASFEGGAMVPFFAIALFTGLRTGPGGELHKLAVHPDRKRLIDLARGVIHVQPEISKTGQYRQAMIRPNLKAWLKAFPGEILPPNHDQMARKLRAKLGLPHDVLRHTFFSMHVAAFKSVGEAAIEGGNTESILKRHYLNLAAYKDGKEFWQIRPPAVTKPSPSA